MYRLTFPALAAGLFALAGCGSGGKYAPVSGTVTLDGKPLAGAMVLFQPVAGLGGDAGAVGSTARTDGAGRFTLTASDDSSSSGAFVGKHTVRIATPPPAGSSAADSDAAGGKGRKAFRDPVPERYNTQTTLTFEVPAGGTDKADFALTTKP